tara:strand:+ start:377 stop:793 length:417 start_codon:yes stop_codon:yes gene_type:complete
MAIPLINGRAYDFAQIVTTILGVPVAGISAVTYTEEQEKVNNYGAGSRPVSRGHGPITASGSVTIQMNDVEAIRDAAPNGSLLQIPSFDITVTYLNAQKPVTHVLKNCEFTSDGVEASQGDTNIERSFDMVISHIKYR